jgi:hypothetical protein
MKDTLARGKAVAASLAGAWRRSPPAFPLAPATLDAILPLLAASGAGGLVWHRLRESSLRTTHAGRELQQHYRQQTLRDIDQQHAIGELLSRLRAAGIEPLLIKGWSSARLYPEPGLRPSCDVDLCVPPDRLEAALTALSQEPLPCAVDLHAGVPDLPDQSWDAVFRRSRLEMLCDVPIRILGPEDRLRLLCLHLARHGIDRPLGLCDVGACLETLPPSFDWNLFRSGGKHLLAWAGCVLGLASRLLGARVPAAQVVPVPAWVERSVLWCWGGGPETPLGHVLRHPIDILRRWRYQGLSLSQSSPMKTAFHLGVGPAVPLPLPMLQVARLVSRKAPRVLRRLVQPRHHVPPSLTIHVP